MGGEGWIRQGAGGGGGHSTPVLPWDGEGREEGREYKRLHLNKYIYRCAHIDLCLYVHI